MKVLVGGKVGDLDAQQVLDRAGDIMAFAHFGCLHHSLLEGLLVGLGLSKVFVIVPPSYTLLKVISVIYLAHLAWKIAMAAPSPEASEIEGAAKPFTFVQAAGFQRVNPRAWAMVLTAMSACMLPDRPMFSLAIIAVVFGLINLPSIFTWAVLGTQVRRFLNRPARLRAFNVTAALLLLASIWPILISSQIGGGTDGARPAGLRNRAGGAAL